MSRIRTEEKSTSLTTEPEKLGSMCGRVGPDPCLPWCTAANSGWIRGLKLVNLTSKLLEIRHFMVHDRQGHAGKDSRSRGSNPEGWRVGMT